MGLKTVEWTLLLCVCALGIQNSMSFIQSMREIEQNCFRDGGYCIHTIPPPAPKRRKNNRRRGGGKVKRPGARMGTRTRSGARPDPRAVAAQHSRLPGSRNPAGGTAPVRGPPPPAYPAAYSPPAAASAAYPPPAAAQYPPPPTGQTPAQPQSNGFFNPNDPFNSLFGMMMFTRKKRQVPEPHERPKIKTGEGMYSFLNQHCRKSEFDFGCRKNGGMCCLPFLNLK